MLIKKITIKLVFGSIQALSSLVVILLAVLLRFNAFEMQAALNASVAAINFYVLILLVFGFVFAVAGLFLVYDWWES
ncbi:MAG: hypothetical protein ACM3JE_03250 [Betaproteobacteria bacterium]